jgi:hypothetical protein
VPKTINIPIDPANEELRQIKQRQKTRQGGGIPAKVTMEMIYQAQLDILENQARQENMLRKLLAEMR